jgi:hypothetical protein
LCFFSRNASAKRIFGILSKNSPNGSSNEGSDEIA